MGCNWSSTQVAKQAKIKDKAKLGDLPRPVTFFLATSYTLSHSHKSVPKLVGSPFLFFTFCIVDIESYSPLDYVRRVISMIVSKAVKYRKPRASHTILSLGLASTISLSPVDSRISANSSFWPNLSQLPRSTTASQAASHIFRDENTPHPSNASLQVLDL